MMALEAGLFRSQPVPARPAFRAFANNVDATLYFLAAYLRGTPVQPGDLPDLREDHRALLQSGDSTSNATNWSMWNPTASPTASIRSPWNSSNG